MTKFGIINFSNNCYLNVIIQIFLSYKETSNIIAHYLDFKFQKDLKYQKDQKCIIDGIINPKKLLNLLSKKMNVSRQNDSQEAFIQILDLISDLEKYYETTIENTYTCNVCNKLRKTRDTFSTFYIHNESIEESVKDLIKNENFELECEYCKENTSTTKSCKIKKLANVLIFYNITKQNINFTENIVYNNTKYNLTGIVKHYGSINFGHYIYIDYKNKLVIDDSNISKLDKIEFDNIYLLFYTI